jgi:hypothetical protein
MPTLATAALSTVVRANNCRAGSGAAGTKIGTPELLVGGVAKVSTKESSLTGVLVMIGTILVEGK